VKDLQWIIINLGFDTYKVLDPRNFQELGYGLVNDILRCNSNTSTHKENDKLLSLLKIN